MQRIVQIVVFAFMMFASERISPQVVINEFLADPQSPLETEWVELVNRGDSTVNLFGWSLGDSRALHFIGSQDDSLGIELRAGEYIVFCDDTSAFRSYYGPIRGTVLQMSSWSILNNDSDMVRLADSASNVVDSFSYHSTFGGNYTWARGEEPGRANSWGRSVTTGGTPGQPNEVYYIPSASSIAVTADHNPFSLTRHRNMSISITVPGGDNLAVRLYDIEGRIVKTLLEKMPPFDASIDWDGRTDGGRTVAPGIYILFVEVTGREQYKQTLVVAP